MSAGYRVIALPISPCGECDACRTGNPHYCLKTWDKAVGLSLEFSGGLTSKINVRSDLVFKVADKITEEVAMVEPTAVGLHAVHLANIKVGEKVLVIGSGIIGLVSAMFAKMEGASYVAISEVNEGRAKRAVELGVADEYILANDKFAENVGKEVGIGFDKVIECCGNSATITSSLMTVKPGENTMAPITIPSVVAVTHEVTMTGAIAYTKEEFKTFITLMEEKQIDVLKFMSKVVSLEKTQA